MPIWTGSRHLIESSNNHIGRAHSAADHLPIYAFTYSTAVVSGLPRGAFGLFCD